MDAGVMTTAAEGGDLVSAFECRFDEPAAQKNSAANNQNLHAGNFRPFPGYSVNAASALAVLMYSS